VNVWKYGYPLVPGVVLGKTASWNDGLVTSSRNYHPSKTYKA